MLPVPFSFPLAQDSLFAVFASVSILDISVHASISTIPISLPIPLVISLRVPIIVRCEFLLRRGARLVPRPFQVVVPSKDEHEQATRRKGHSTAKRTQVGSFEIPGISVNMFSIRPCAARASMSSPVKRNTEGSMIQANVSAELIPLLCLRLAEGGCTTPPAPFDLTPCSSNLINAVIV